MANDIIQNIPMPELNKGDKTAVLRLAAIDEAVARTSAEKTEL